MKKTIQDEQLAMGIYFEEHKEPNVGTKKSIKRAQDWFNSLTPAHKERARKMQRTHFLPKGWKGTTIEWLYTMRFCIKPEQLSLFPMLVPHDLEAPTPLTAEKYQQ